MLTQVSLEVAVGRVLDDDSTRSTGVAAGADETSQMGVVLETTQSRQLATKRRPARQTLARHPPLKLPINFLF